MFAESKLRDFIEAVAAKTPTPGGGSVSAAVASLGAALGIKAARFSEGGIPQKAAADLEPLKEELLKLVDVDAEAYGQVKSAYGLPKKSDEEKRRRKEVIQTALKEAAAVPLQGMRAAVKALAAILSYAEESNKNLISDLAGAAIFLEAGTLGCSLNVKINAQGLDDKAHASGLEREAGALIAEASRLRLEILKVAEKKYGAK